MADVTYVRSGTSFVWDDGKDAANQHRHGIAFRVAAEAFFDPFARVVDASRHQQDRDKLIGYLDDKRLVAVVHLELDGDAYRIISAWPATTEERAYYDS
ncbi:BrnT family toxin [Pseudoxanthomonas suwonensis]|uniref:BrnT family toxin n=1 Tax=Pseudoxanthomonas suwonensis TaxID=314722 RepID=A0A0E3UNM0_9GAMM|nr:BrnT family toxin [Pseudoxanthomonas suwonensis]AKC87301.1 hypothetical protein WQ53_11580 [Pseudoxanthomonas suwonensis]